MNVIITGSTGMIGNGVLQECLENDEIDSILLLNRKPLNIENKKVREVIVSDFFDLSNVESEFIYYDACFFCIGTTSSGLSEEEYMKTTYYLPLMFSNILARYNQEMTFCYISAMGADITETSSTFWERIKGKTENALLKGALENVYIFRPAVTKPDETSPKRTWIHKISLPFISIFYPLLKLIFPSYCTTTQNIAKAMISVSKKSCPKKQFDVADINKLLKKRSLSE